MSALAPFGRCVTYGIASRGAEHRPAPGRLMRRSHAVVGFWLMHCIGRPAMIDEALADLFARVASGELRVVVGGTYALADAAQAQVDLRERRTTGKVLLDPTAQLAAFGAAAAGRGRRGRAARAAGVVQRLGPRGAARPAARLGVAALARRQRAVAATGSPLMTNPLGGSRRRSEPDVGAGRLRRTARPPRRGNRDRGGRRGHLLAPRAAPRRRGAHRRRQPRLPGRRPPRGLRSHQPDEGGEAVWEHTS